MPNIILVFHWKSIASLLLCVSIAAPSFAQAPVIIQRSGGGVVEMQVTPPPAQEGMPTPPDGMPPKPGGKPSPEKDKGEKKDDKAPKEPEAAAPVMRKAEPPCPTG